MKSYLREELQRMGSECMVKAGTYEVSEEKKEERELK